MSEDELLDTLVDEFSFSNEPVAPPLPSNKIVPPPVRLSIVPLWSKVILLKSKSVPSKRTSPLSKRYSNLISSFTADDCSKVNWN